LGFGFWDSKAAAKSPTEHTFNFARPSIFAKSCTLVQKIYMDSMAIERTFGRRSCGSNTEASKCTQNSGIHIISQVKFFLQNLTEHVTSFLYCTRSFETKLEARSYDQKLKRQFPENSFKGCSDLKHFWVIIRIAHGPPDPTSALCGLEPCFLP
jgi:hypothetical protein